MMTRIALALALGVVAAPAAAQDGLTRIEKQLAEVSNASALQDYRFDGQALTGYSLAGLLAPHGSVTLVLDLWKGRSYRITGVCDAACANLDLGLRSSSLPDAAVVAEDALADKVPMLEFVAASSGPHFLAVDMRACTAERCYFGINVLSK